jgi:shikimate dehydrogenase
MPEQILRSEDLTGISQEGVSLAVLGFPIGHSISPDIHNAALSEMAKSDCRFAKWNYRRIEVESERLSEVLPILLKEGFRGLNLTIPHKVKALDLVVELSAEAKGIGAVNTLLACDDGWRGFNTDGYGLEQALREELEVDLEGAKVILLGAGGAARAAATQCLLRGCRELWVGNRSPNRLAELLAALPEVDDKKTSVKAFTFDEASSVFADQSEFVLINATSLGLRPEDPAPLDLSALSMGAKVYDMVYNPAETALLRQARDLGLRGTNGLSMLVNQAARSLAIWTGKDVPVDAMFEAARKKLS